MDGIELMKRTIDLDPDLPVILITAYGDISMAVQAMHDGAYDFIEKPEHQKKFVFPEFEPADPGHLEQNHGDALIRRVADTSGRRYDYLDQDTATSAKSYEAALLAAGAVIKGVDMLMEG